jgi:hypothetical protein
VVSSLTLVLILTLDSIQRVPPSINGGKAARASSSSQLHSFKLIMQEITRLQTSAAVWLETLLFCDLTQRRFVFVYRLSGQHIAPIFKGDRYFVPKGR